MQILPIEKENLPEEFDIDFGEDTYTLKFMYNETTDSFSVSLLRLEGEELEELIMGEKLVLNKAFWKDFNNNWLPPSLLIPMDLSRLETRITWENFGKTVFVYVDDTIGDGEEIGY